MKKLITGILLFTSAACAQMTVDQRVADFQNLAALYAKQYAPYEWKRTLFGFDLYNLSPWLERVRAAKDDLEFYDLEVQYVASLNDTHDSFSIPSDYFVQLGFSADIYDGKVLIEGVSRAALPVATYPFTTGDELVSVDGRAVEDLLKDYAKYGAQSNPRSTRRIAATRIVSRPQSRMAFVAQLPEKATVVVRRASGAMETYSIAWLKSGTPVRVGPVPMPKVAAGPTAGILPDSDDDTPEYMKAWYELQHAADPEPVGVLNYGSRAPYYALPAGFVQRRGTRPTDFYYSGTYQSDGLRIGYIRIPSYGSLSAATMQEFQDEMTFFQANTDGLVVDQSRNPGGFLCAGENVMAMLTPYRFHATGFAYRATWSRVNSFWSTWQSAIARRADQWMIDLYGALYKDISQAYKEQRGLTGPLPVCTPSLDRDPATDETGKVIAYTKPVLMLIDEFSTSTGDSVPSMFQDAKRGKLFGMRTNGAGGTNMSFPVGAWGEGFAGMTLGLQVRTNPVATPEYPTSSYIETVGVRPDIEYDYMTRDNLVSGGRSFVAAFTAAVVDLIKK